MHIESFLKHFRYSIKDYTFYTQRIVIYVKLFVHLKFAIKNVIHYTHKCKFNLEIDYNDNE